MQTKLLINNHKENIIKELKFIIMLGILLPSIAIAGNIAQDKQAKNETTITKTKDFIDSRDGQVYPTVQIGTQVWMTKNLAYKTAGSFAYKDDEKNIEKYGRLYLFESLQDAVPAGWHVATDEEWKTLEKNLGMSEKDRDISDYMIKRGSTEGEDIKIGGKTMLDFPMAGFRRRVEKNSPYLYRFTNPTADFAISVRLVKDDKKTANPTAQQQLEANKKLVVDFYNEVLFRGDYNAIDKYIGDVYIQHNPQVADGKKALLDILKQYVKNPGKEEPSGEIVRIIAESDLVVLHIHNFSFPKPRGSAVVDIFRVKDGKIVEHWDVAQDIPEKMEHDNGMF